MNLYKFINSKINVGRESNFSSLFSQSSSLPVNNPIILIFDRMD